MPDAIAFFDAIASRYDRDYARSRDASRGSLARVLAALPPAAKVLDLGIGTGRELPTLLDAGHSVVGVDASVAMVAECNKRARTVPITTQSFYAPLPFDDATFDAVIALHGTLAHPPDAGATARLVTEVARLLRPGGAFVTEMPSVAWLDALEASPIGTAERRLERTGPQTAHHTDARAGVDIVVTVLTEAEWRDALASDFEVVQLAADGHELFVVARRRADGGPSSAGRGRAKR